MAEADVRAALNRMQGRGTYTGFRDEVGARQDFLADVATLSAALDAGARAGESDTRTIEGTVVLQRGAAPSQCVCCPDGQTRGHVFRRNVALDPWPSCYAEHIGRDADVFLMEFYARNANEGRRVRITAALLPPATPERGNGT